MLPGAALSSFAARFCWQGQHFRLWTVPERVSGPPPLDAARRSTFEPRGSFLLAGAALQALDGARARCQAQHFRASRLVSAGRGSTSGSGRCPSAFRGPPSMLPGAALWSFAARFCWQGQHQALDGARARFGAPPLNAARRSTFLDGARARFGAPPPRCCQAQHFGASRLVSAGTHTHTHTPITRTHIPTLTDTQHAHTHTYVD